LFFGIGEVWGRVQLFSGVIAERIRSFQGLNDLEGYKNFAN
jgi:hypothetical protein